MFAVKNEILDRKRFSPPNLKGATESVKRNALTVNQVMKILEAARTEYKITHYLINPAILTAMYLLPTQANRLENAT